jgi:predicted permease
MMSDLVHRIRALFRRSTVDREVDDELQLHIERQIEKYVNAGQSPAEAMRRARMEFGAIAQVKEECREALGVRLVDDLRRDLVLAMRSFRAAPIGASVAVLSLALGIGANTAMFSIVDSLFLQPLPVTDPGRLAVLLDTSGRRTHWTNPIWESVREQSSMFAGAAAWSSNRFNLATGGETDLVDGLWVSGGFFDVLGVPAARGRTLAAADDVRGGGANGPVAVISSRCWQRRFGSDPGAVGRTLTIERVPYTIVGVTGSEFFGLDVGQTFDVAIPIGTEPLMRGAESRLDRRSNWWLQIVARLRPGQTVQGMQPMVTDLHARVRATTLPPGWSPATYLPDGFALTAATTGVSDLRGRYRRPLLAITAVAALVLLIACVNIANLFLARARVRRQELSLRTALGASRLRLVRQLLAESLLIAAAGAVLGLAGARWASGAILASLSTSTRLVSLPIALNWHALLFTAAVTIATVLVFGVGPAFAGTRVQPNDALRAGRRVTGERGTFRVAHLLIAAQVTLTLVLVVTAALFSRTLSSLARVPLGFEPESVLIANVTVPNELAKPEQRAELFRRLSEASAAVPGVAGAAISETTPLSNNTWNNRVQVSAAPGAAPVSDMAYFNAVGPDWFRTYGTRVLAGREFGASDSAAGAPVAIVNQAFARIFAGGRTPIGLRVGQGDEPPREIVGIVGDALYESLRAPAPPTVYIPYTQRGTPPPYVSIGVRAAHGSAAALAKPLLGALTSQSRNVSVTLQPLSEHIDAALTQERVLAVLSGFFGVLGLLLAALGLYGVTSYGVHQRRTEIGIRMALGALPRGVVGLVLARVAVFVSIGIAAGVAASLWVGTYVSSLLYGLTPADPLSLALAIVVVIVTACAAGSIPAWRASRVDPARVLREG